MEIVLLHLVVSIAGCRMQVPHSWVSRSMDSMDSNKIDMMDSREMEVVPRMSTVDA